MDLRTTVVQSLVLDSAAVHRRHAARKASRGLRTDEPIDAHSGPVLEPANGALGQRAEQTIDRTRPLAQPAQLPLQMPHRLRAARELISRALGERCAGKR